MDAPRNLRAVAVDNCAIKVQWERPDDGPKAYSFRLYMRKQGEDDVAWQRVAQDKDLLSFTTNPLEPITTYEFRVQSFGIQGDGPFSGIAQATTAAKPPSDPPANLRAADVKMESIRVAWDPPTRANGDIQSYLLYIDEQGHDTFAELDLDGDVTSYETGYLQKDTVYRFQVCALNAAGEGPLSSILCVRTQQDPRSRFLRAKSKDVRPVTGHKMHTIRDVPSTTAEANDTQDSGDKAEGANSSGSGKAQPTLPSDWKPRHDRPVLQLRRQKEMQARAEEAARRREEAEAAEAERRRREEHRRQQRERAQQMESVFMDMMQESQQQQDKKVKQFRVAPAAGSALSRGVSADQVDPLRERKEREQQHMESQLQSSTDDDADVPSIMPGKTLKSLSGTIRGKKRAVRTALETLSSSSKFESELLERLYNEEKNNQIVIYVTSVTAVRQTYEDCQKMLRIFQLLKKKVRVKDVSLDSRFAIELHERLSPTAQVPQAFINYFHLGDLERVTQLNETGQLRKMLVNFEERCDDCTTCGGRGFVPCGWCFGSKKSITNKFAEGHTRNLKCTVCNENGLQRCESC